VITTKKAKEGKAEVSFSSTFTVHPYSYYKKNRTNAADVIAMEREWATMALSTPEAAEMQAADLRENGPYPSLGVNTLLDMYTGKISWLPTVINIMIRQKNMVSVTLFTSSII